MIVFELRGGEKTFSATSLQLVMQLDVNDARVRASRHLGTWYTITSNLLVDPPLFLPLSLASRVSSSLCQTQTVVSRFWWCVCNQQNKFRIWCLTNNSRSYNSSSLMSRFFDTKLLDRLGTDENWKLFRYYIKECDQGFRVWTGMGRYSVQFHP